MTVRRSCKDCGSQSRVLYSPGPRCATCRSRYKEASKRRSHGLRIFHLYKMTTERYEELHAAQGGVCALCRVATGKARRLAVDHDHACCPQPPTCGRCTRGLICGPCNLMVIGRLGPAGLDRAVRYLTNPPFPALYGSLTDENPGPGVST